MQVNIANNYEEMCSQALAHLSMITATFDEALICPASGNTPEGLYKQVVAMVNQNVLSINHWDFVGLDEWVGMNGTDEGSCRYSLNEQFFGPLQVPENKICFFDGRADNLEEECRKTELYIKQHGGIDVAIVGLGMNGHIAMNEPGTNPALRSHISKLAPDTQLVGQKYFNTPKQLSTGLTLGIASLMEARHVLLMVSGIKKAAIVREVMTAPITNALPATLFRDHPGLHVYIDKDAASYLQA